MFSKQSVDSLLVGHTGLAKLLPLHAFKDIYRFGDKPLLQIPVNFQAMVDGQVVVGHSLH